MATAAIRPPHGELAETDWQAANLTIAETPGVLAGEEMCHWLARRVGEPDGDAP